MLAILLVFLLVFDRKGKRTANSIMQTQAQTETQTQAQTQTRIQLAHGKHITCYKHSALTLHRLFNEKQKLAGFTRY